MVDMVVIIIKEVVAKDMEVCDIFDVSVYDMIEFITTIYILYIGGGYNQGYNQRGGGRRQRW